MRGSRSICSPPRLREKMMRVLVQNVCARNLVLSYEGEITKKGGHLKGSKDFPLGGEKKR